MSVIATATTIDFTFDLLSGWLLQHHLVPFKRSHVQIRKEP